MPDDRYRDPVAWLRKPLLARLKLLVPTGPCGQSSAVLNDRLCQQRTLKEAMEAIGAASILRSDIDRLRQRLAKFEEFAKAHEALEAAMLTDGGTWFERFDEQLHDEFMEVQRLRNQAVHS